MALVSYCTDGMIEAMRKLLIAPAFAVMLLLAGCSSQGLDAQVREELAAVTIASAEKAEIEAVGIRCASLTNAEIKAELESGEAYKGDSVDDLYVEEEGEESTPHVGIVCTVRDVDDSYGVQLCSIHLDGQGESSCLSFDSFSPFSDALSDFASSSSYRDNEWQVYPVK